MMNGMDGDGQGKDCVQTRDVMVVVLSFCQMRYCNGSGVSTAPSWRNLRIILFLYFICSVKKPQGTLYSPSYQPSMRKPT